jgi:hypothetical protein
MKTMKAIPALTLHRPWPNLIVFELKTIETRTHNRFRGLVGQTIAIHAGLHDEGYPANLMCRHLAAGDVGRAMLHADKYPGCVVGTAYVKAHRLLTDADSRAALCPADGLYGLDLVDVRRFREPIKATGQRGIWTWEPPENWRGLLI